MIDKIKCLQSRLNPQKITILVFALYFALGLLIFADYGISYDEPQERRTSLVNYVYVMGRMMSAQDSESVQHILHITPNLMDWHDRYYGVFLQTITVFFEHMNNFEMSTRDIFLMRHAFTFINYFIASVFFYLILRRRFGAGSFIPLLGALFFILSPRFFGESFYNIKDILFYSWVVISSYYVLRWLEDEDKKAFLIPAAITLAIATNTRILGISVLLLAGGFVFIQGLMSRSKFGHYIKQWLILSALTFVFYVIITPFTWENPIGHTIDTFFHFLWFQPWGGMHFYMGEMITSDVPWHYIPVWMGITIPILYIILFFVGIAAVFVKKGRPHMYDLFFATMFMFTILGYIILNISMYEGWRHAYSLYLPFLYLAVYGLAWLHRTIQNKRKVFKIGLACVVAVSLLHSTIWIAVNHPYQYVYFNIVGRRFAERNFTLDYWDVSSADLVRYVVQLDKKPISTIFLPHFTHYILTDQEQSSIIRTDRDNAEFFIQTSRVAYETRLYGPGDGFEQIAAIAVDGMNIATLFRRVMPFDIRYDFNAWNKVARFESNINSDINPLHDGDAATWWTTGRPQQTGDYMLFEFDQVVSFNYFYLNQGRAPTDYPRGLAIYTSLDGATWRLAPGEVLFNRHFFFDSEPYAFLRLELKGYHDMFWWSISDMNFGFIDD